MQAMYVYVLHSEIRNMNMTFNFETSYDKYSKG